MGVCKKYPKHHQTLQKESKASQSIPKYPNRLRASQSIPNIPKTQQEHQSSPKHRNAAVCTNRLLAPVPKAPQKHPKAPQSIPKQKKPLKCMQKVSQTPPNTSKKSPKHP